jgi:hypothetical protein
MGRPLSKHEGTEEYAIYKNKKLNQEIAGARQQARDALLSQNQRLRAADARNPTPAVWSQFGCEGLSPAAWWVLSLPSGHSQKYTNQ